jgi:hypothetical protein
MNCYFVSFADSKYKKTLYRIGNEAKNMEFFQGIYCLSDENIDTEFIKKHKTFINNNKRGFGYFLWKPQIIIQTLSLIPENDFLLYTDAGCSLKKEGLPRLKNYIEKADQEHIVPFHMRGMKECYWTKMDVLDRLKFTSDINMNSDQCIGTTHLWKNSTISKDFLKTYLELCEYYPNIDDSPSVLPNHIGFQEHRHDQSVFSILIKKNNLISLPDETWWYPNWDEHTNYPIHATRLKF